MRKSERDQLVFPQSTAVQFLEAVEKYIKPLFDLDWLIEGIEEQANAVLKERGVKHWQSVPASADEVLRLASNALMFLKRMREEIANGNAETAAVYGIKCGACAGGLPGAGRLQAKLSRTKKPVLNFILSSRAEGKSEGTIALDLNKRFKKKSGKPYTSNDVKGYINRDKNRHKKRG